MGLKSKDLKGKPEEDFDLSDSDDDHEIHVGDGFNFLLHPVNEADADNDNDDQVADIDEDESYGDLDYNIAAIHNNEDNGSSDDDDGDGSDDDDNRKKKKVSEVVSSPSDSEDEDNEDDDSVEEDSGEEADDLSDDLNEGSADDDEELVFKTTGSKKGKNLKRKLDEPVSDCPQLGSQSASKKTKVDSVLFTPPSNEELHQLKEAENLFHSSLFRLQLTELLNEIQLKEKRKKLIDEVLHGLKKVLTELPEGKQHEISNQKWVEKKKIKVPLIQQPWGVKGKFCFYPPSKVKVTGSYLLDTCLKSDVQVDLAVEMPQLCFQPKDHLNHRYLRKRALYLTCLATHLRKSDLVNDMKFTYHHGNHFKPILVLNMQAGTGKFFTVNLHAVPEPGVFKLNRFSITKNNVRQQWFSGTESETTTNDESQPPTPYYNTAILQDVTMMSQLEHVYKTLQNSPGVREGVCLLKVWLRQRELYKGYGAFSGFILSMYISYLLSIKKINRLMSCYQVVRSALLHLSQSDWTTEPLTLHSDLGDPHCPTAVEFYQHFDVVFIDKTGYVNLCAEWTRDMFFRVKHEASLSLKALDDREVDGFESLFMKRVPFLQKFDHVFHISHLDTLKEAVELLNMEDRYLDRGGNCVSACLSALLELLYKALGQRVHLIQVKSQPAPQWSIDEDAPKCVHNRLSVGLSLNPEHSSSVLERGPPADSVQAKEFRSFWCDRSELRRFQDGGICEAVVWSGKTVSAKRLTPSLVIKYILKRHAGIPKKNVTYIGGQFDGILNDSHEDLRSHSVTTGEEGHMTVLASYEELCKLLRSFDDLPLTINTIQGTSPIFRFTEVFPPHAFSSGDKTNFNQSKALKDLPTWTPVHRVVCLLEGSGKWPEDKDAIRRLKAAFYIKLGELLTEKNLQVRVRPDHVDVCRDGFVFRLKIAYLHEITVLKTVKTPDGMVQMRDTAESVELEREVVSLPKLTSTLHGIQQRYNTFSVVVRLAKRWLSAHLMSDYLSEEALELIVAHLYITPAPFSAPSSPVCGLLRFLSLMSQFDWRTNPLMVNLNQAFTKKDYADIPSHFTKERAIFPAMCIMTPLDKTTSPWTRENPPAQIVHRVTVLARESLTLLESHLTQGSQMDYKQVFRPPLDMYDVVIHLRPKHLPRIHQAVDQTPNIIHGCHSNTNSQEGFPVTEFDPLRCYVQELRDTYGDLALFFHDTYGGNLVAVLWKPQTFQPQPFKVTQLNARMVDMNSASHKEVKTLPNMEAVLEDFRVLGGGLVEQLDIRTEKWKD
ncbi:nucleolar protein 6-like [Liolophura sinensis]|uniref:nucleolar protein 6-like n=1 Tax=Liolophura sinensis TaxID=3198878 RepID=UPI00315903BA